MTYWLYPKRTIIYVKKAMSNADADRPPVDVAIFVIDVSGTVLAQMRSTITVIWTPDLYIDRYSHIQDAFKYCASHSYNHRLALCIVLIYC